MGIPIANVPVARALTLPGYAAGVARGALMRGRNLRTANQAFQAALNSGPLDASRVAYHRDMATTLYKVMPGGLAGLGDDIDEVTDLLESGAFSEPSAIEPPSQSGGDSWWEDVLKTFSGQLGLGVAGRIAGQNPWAKPPVIAPTGPSITTVALVGGGVIVGAYLLTRAFRKR